MKPYYSHAGIEIYHGDAHDVIPLLGAVDHVITDPPYDNRTHKGARGDGGKTAEPLIAFAPITPEMLSALYSRAVDIFNLRWLVSTMAWQHVAKFEENPPAGWRFVRCGAWIKPNGAPQFTGDRPGQGWEAVCIMHSDGVKMRWNGGGHHATWSVNIEQGEHPTQKPVKLYRQFVEQFTDPGDTILDPFMGSGTTLRAAKDCGRKAIGIELDEKYCELAARRLAQEVLPI
jgi:site-specific DNA-methyltransferase (adenine-specific)